MSNVTIYSGPTKDPGNYIGFVQEHADGFKAFNTGKVLLGAFADINAAADAILFDCLKPHYLAGTADLNGEDLLKVIQPADQTQEFIEITELEPAFRGFFAGKRIEADDSITEYPKVARWRQNVADVPATIPQLFDYLRKRASATSS